MAGNEGSPGDDRPSAGGGRPSAGPEQPADANEGVRPEATPTGQGDTRPRPDGGRPYPDRDRLTSLRRELHRYPEPAWREFHTTCRLVEELRRIGVDELAIGPEAYDPGDRLAVPEPSELDRWYGRALDRGADPEILERLEGGNTGAVAVLECGPGPAVGLRVDIDGLFVEESTAADHEPAAEGFRSTTDETMHACGHDAHMTVGLGVVEAVKESDFSGRLVVFFQPAEEESGGGKPMAEGPYAEGLDYLLALHVGLGHPTGEVVAGIERPLAMAHLHVDIEGTSAHAGKAPNEGHNAIQAMATAVDSVYGIPRHGDGMTRVNVGRVEGGTASNVVADHVRLVGEVRGETTGLMEYVHDEFERRVHHAAETHGCSASVEVHGKSPRADSDPELQRFVADVARGVDGVDTVRERADFGASEDATFLMRRVQEDGGLATYLIVGTDHPTSHHTSTFDVDERSLPVGVDVVSRTIMALSESGPER